MASSSSSYSKVINNIMNSFRHHDYKLLIDALYYDCKNIIELYNNYTESTHLSDAKFMKEQIEEHLYTTFSPDDCFHRINPNMIGLRQLLLCIINNDYSVKAKHRSDSLDGPIDSAECIEFKKVFASLVV